ncbi:asparagine synthase (glutamine-hydrolyzing) [Jiangella muralis]|uniref:asparagine synthase (glutamine-hydrolyzing) n=1 Tax=Jiangella muralis TaxID=702383 RepID=UPI00069D1834|nr:asparagine synthase (glutamine-hydrolyzing) [Jiangella muralis]
MCGITGWVSYDSDLRSRRHVIDDMVATMERRGPDDSGVWLRRNVALGHRRLAVIDLDGGKQPMTIRTPNGTVALTYSGEVYNYQELRRELIGKGHRFRTQSDTEVVLNAYAEWGDTLVDHLNGMFAFALWDDRDSRLLLIRDRLGVKPLYYYPTADGVLFGSEPKAILAHPFVKKVVDLEGLRGLMSHALFTKPPGWSLWKGMSEVLPGTVVSVDADGIRSRTYWQLQPSEHRDDRQSTIEHVRELLDDIVQRQLVADVPRCVLLSGGLDSSTITGLAARQLDNDGSSLRTFSVDFAGHEQNFTREPGWEEPDSRFVRDMVAYRQLRHEVVMLDAETLKDPAVRRARIAARDLPSGFGDFDTSLYLLFDAIKSNSTVALSGETADEVFGGYPWMHDEAAQRDSTFPWISFIRARTDDPLPWVSGELRRTMDLNHYIDDLYRSAAAEIDYLDDVGESERRMRTVFYLSIARFVRYLLDRKDRLSMAVGLEVRVPFCDHRLVEYVYNVPWSLKTFDGQEKSLLRAASGDVVPRSIRNRKKAGYPLTQDADYLRNIQEQAQEVLGVPSSPVFELIDRSWLEHAAKVDAESTPRSTRSGIEAALDLHHWFDLYKPRLEL